MPLTLTEFRALPLSGGLLPALSADLEHPDEADLFWLGQAGFAIRWDGRLLLVDPYLSDSLADKYRDHEYPHVRMMTAPAAPESLRGVDLLLCTHRHSDHMDPGSAPTIARVNPGCRIVLPRAEYAHAISLGLPEARLHGMAAGESWEPFEGARVEAIPSAHETLAVNDRGEHANLGYIMTLGGIRFYHSGDCVPYDGLAETLRGRTVDLALLPINGRSEYLRERGIAGNFTAEEALLLCREAGISLLICHHFGMFEFNTVDPREVERRIAALGAPLRASVRCVLPKTTERYIVRKRKT